MVNNIDTVELAKMVRHWLRTPPNGYLGSPYGSDVHALLQRPMTDGMADDLILKMRQDIPLLDAMPSGSVNVYLSDIPDEFDQKQLIVEIADQVITVS